MSYFSETTKIQTVNPVTRFYDDYAWIVAFVAESVRCASLRLIGIRDMIANSIYWYPPNFG